MPAMVRRVEDVESSRMVGRRRPAGPFVDQLFAHPDAIVRDPVGLVEILHAQRVPAGLAGELQGSGAVAVPAAQATALPPEASSAGVTSRDRVALERHRLGFETARSMAHAALGIGNPG